jgi:4-hydroxybutyrate CoA-transferase
MQMVTAADALGAIPDGSRIVLPHGTVEPTVFYDAFVGGHTRFRRLALYSGLQFGTYPFLAAGLGEHFAYTTWQAAPRLRPLFAEGRIAFIPLRFSQIGPAFAADGPLRPDVVVIQTSPPVHGRVSLGISVSLFPDLVASARLVIAEVNPAMPVTAGQSLLPVERIHLAVESSAPLGMYTSSRRTARDEQIADRVLGLIPDRAWVQLGVGAIPDLVLPRLAGVPGVNLHSGMLTDGLVAFVEGCRHTPRVVTGEVAGGQALYDFVGRTPAIELHASRVTHSVFVAGRLPRFTAINSAIEVDLGGQVNGESVDGVQVSGVGGSLDFAEAAAYAPGGLSIVALPSTTEDGRRSKIVGTLGAATPVTIPRVVADVVVTEHGIARLRGRDLGARAEALIAVAHPAFRDGLAHAAQRWLRDRGSPAA